MLDTSSSAWHFLRSTRRAGRVVVTIVGKKKPPLENARGEPKVETAPQFVGAGGSGATSGVTRRKGARGEGSGKYGPGAMASDSRIRVGAAA